MPVVDSLLNLIAAQRAEGLLITSDQAPHLIYGEEKRPLSMPPIGAATVEDFAREVRASVTSSVDPGSATEAVARYTTQGGDEFDVRMEGADATLQLLFRPAVSEVDRGDHSHQSASHAPPTFASAEPDEPGPQAAAPGAPQSDARLLGWLSRLEQEGASDLILSSGACARFRSGGVLRELPGPALSDAEILEFFASAMDDAARECLRSRGSVDLAMEFGAGGAPARFRVNIFKQHRGVAAALRPVRRDPPSLLELNLPDHLYELAQYPNGLALVTGPTGSGKSTTVAALVEHLNRSVDRHVITLEDPIEFLFEPKSCLIHQRELGQHVESFSDGLRAALREDPDVILVGEMRDRDTIAAALTAAETGHLVLSTLHSASPWMSIDRMIDVFPADQQRQVRLQLSDVLRAIVSQHLLPSTTPPLRIPAFEKLRITTGVASQIREDKLNQIQTSIQTGRDNGMVSLERSLADLLRAKRIDSATARAAARDERLLTELCQG